MGCDQQHRRALSTSDGFVGQSKPLLGFLGLHGPGLLWSERQTDACCEGDGGSLARTLTPSPLCGTVAYALRLTSPGAGVPPFLKGTLAHLPKIIAHGTAI